MLRSSDSSFWFNFLMNLWQNRSEMSIKSGIAFAPTFWLENRSNWCLTSAREKSCCVFLIGRGGNLDWREKVKRVKRKQTTLNQL